jgi:tetratricopeptide (TPR) repeat protein
MACARTIPNPGLRSRFCRKAVGLVLLAGVLAAPAVAAPQSATLTVTTKDGYARLAFTAADYIDASVRQAGNVLIIRFKEPLDVSVSRVAEQAPDYIGAARRDPDGQAVRMALSQDVTVHTIAADEKFFVDLLPKSWSGLPPSLPQDVVDELVRRAREAEKVLQRQGIASAAKTLTPIRVHVASQPTFTRYVFHVTNQTAVSANRTKDRLVLNFDQPLPFDLADAQAALAPGVTEINSEVDGDTAAVRFIFASKIDVRTFRDESGFVVDLAKPSADGDAAAGLQQDAPPATVPAGGLNNQSAAGEGAAAPGTPVPSLADAAAKISAAATGAPTANAPMRAAPAMTNPAATNPAATARPAAAPPKLEEPPAAAAPPVQKPAPAPSAAAAMPAPAAAPAAPKQAAAPPLAMPPAAAPPAAASGPAPAAAPPPSNKQGSAAAPAAAVASGSSPAPPAAPPSTTNKAATATPAAAAANPPAQNPAVPSAAAKTTAAPGGNTAGGIAAELNEQDGDIKLSFPFDSALGAAVFQRADTLWIVFDAKAAIDLSALDGEPSHVIRSSQFSHSGGADVVRLKLDRPHLSSVAAEGSVWTVHIGDSIADPTRPLTINRELIGPDRANVSIPLSSPQQVHQIDDPAEGDSLFVVTALPPARGLIAEQDFVEFHALASTQGVAIVPLADDLTVKLAKDKIVVGRPPGLTLSTPTQKLLSGSSMRAAMFDSEAWGHDLAGPYFDGQDHLIAVAAAAPEPQRLLPRLELARFYIARGMYPEAKGVLDVAVAAQRNSGETGSALVLRAIAEVMMGRPDDALKDLAEPGVGDQHDAPLWRALAYARQGQWTQARDTFKTMAAAMATLPVELQRVALKEDMRSAIEVGDFDGASNALNDFQTIGIPHAMEPSLAVLMGRLAEGLGRKEDALAAYRTAADSWDRPAAAQGQLRETVLRYQLGDLKRDDVISRLETLTTIWRGDETEIEALKVLAHLYTEEGRYRDAFYVMRSAMAARPDSALTHQIQDEAAHTFDQLFLTGMGDRLPAIDALSLFYDFRELVPIGSRGDEMIRRLADRLVSVDLLDQAASLLQYQVDHRLDGAARAEVATRLAVVYLMDRKPDRALAVLRASRTANLTNDMRDQRLLLEARALSDLGRHDVALEVIADVAGRPALRLRADILWAAKRYDESAEQLELLLGDRGKDFTPLNADEQADIMRAEVGYAIAQDQLGLGRFRDRYAAAMAATPDAHAFAVVSAPLGTSGDEFASVAHAAASADTLETFLRDTKAYYPNSPAAAPPAAAPSEGTPSASSSPLPPDMQAPAPSLPPLPPAQASGRTAMR